MATMCTWLPPANTPRVRALEARWEWGGVPRAKWGVHALPKHKQRKIEIKGKNYYTSQTEHFYVPYLSEG